MRGDTDGAAGAAGWQDKDIHSSTSEQSRATSPNVTLTKSNGLCLTEHCFQALTINPSALVLWKAAVSVDRFHNHCMLGRQADCRVDA